MKPVAIAAVFSFFLALPGAIWAQEPPPGAQALPVVASETPTEPTVAGTSGDASEAPGVVPLKKGASAPFLGLLVPEARFVELLEAKNKAHELAARLAAADRTAEIVEQVYLTKLEQAAIVRWYNSPSFNRWLGIFLGTAVTGISVWGASKLTK